VSADTRLDSWAAEIGLGSLAGRRAKRTTRAAQILDFVGAEAHPERFGRMLIGLYLAFVSVAEEVLSAVGKAASADPLTEFERVETDSRGRAAKTLTFLVPQEGKAPRRIGIRTRYDAVVAVVRGRLRRFDYPSSGPYSTQAWVSHRDNLTAIFAMSPNERRAVAEGLWALVLALPEHTRRTVPRSGVAPFVEVLTNFRPSGRGILSGASWQGLTYGFMRADAPTLSLRTERVRSGGRRENRVGDIDGYYGADVALTAEVKDFEIKTIDVLDDFISNLGEWPDAVAFVVCGGAAPDVVEQAAEMNVAVITREQLVAAVRLWPISKQMDGVRSALEYFVHVEQKEPLIAAFEQFLAEKGIVPQNAPASSADGPEDEDGLGTEPA
jgi:hypothetical protein